ncbi:hypothetical protein [Frondihabitans peucedani]|uniref:Uncharacterized protein n=1 Tax=Frondihabitans peucedani TaxID=598626 RepID=A0ABP8E371_9MICO
MESDHLAVFVAAHHTGGVDVMVLAGRLVDRAQERGQAVLRCDTTTPVEQLRHQVRRIAAERRVQIRTGMIDDVFAVVLADAGPWDEPVSIMRRRLPRPTTANTVH